MSLYGKLDFRPIVLGVAPVIFLYLFHNAFYCLYLFKFSSVKLIHAVTNCEGHAVVSYW